ncbi:MAG: ADP-glyceromanno-heptose 6-epimerase [Halobacteriovoraceae bacterium]|nr:ADP-glyceromanno-heptose 6-epimerase [Halobacteriovoraceae bacterium]MCB9095602.1 ADP-glyceromanno-heptose 6-epimerase [Halobacteriovoraceae bacterium]
MIIVTGGAGFIGSALIYELNKRGRKDIVVVDRFRSGDKWLNLRGLEIEEFLPVEKFLALESWRPFQSAEAFFHLGACSSTTEMDMDFLLDNNFAFSKNIFDYCCERNIPFYYASSAATYGAGEQGYNDNHESIPRLRPLNKYGYSKQLFDEYVLKSKNKPELWMGYKYFNVFGPNEYHKESMVSVVYRAFQQIGEDGKVKLFKSHRDDFHDGEQKRDFVYVMDVVKAMVDVFEKVDSSEASGIYNLGTGVARTFNDLAKATFKAMGKPENIEYIAMPDNVRNQYQYFTEANMEKFLKTLPEFRFRTLEQAVSHYVQNYLAKENPYLDTDQNEV